ncbi:MAG: hypothetical protein QOE66_254, partial [Chloroflexota bacterium]|nr:hypothetical protein [Chloroflexota bacterium]
MELHVPLPSSADGLHEMPEPAPPPTHAPTTGPAPTPDAPETANGGPSAPAPASAAADSAKEGAKPAVPETKAARAKKRRRRRVLRREAPAWAVSLVVHVVVLTFLGLATFSGEVQKVVANINSALVANPTGADEMVHIYADPSDTPRDQAVGSAGSSTGSEQGGGGSMGGIGSGPPSATPRVAGVGRGIGEKSSLPGVKVVANVSGLGMLPSTAKLGIDLGGGGMIGGDVTYETSDVGVALDQLAREILRHLSQHKLTVVWLFDESESMKDDQRAIREKFDRVASELKVNAEGVAKKSASSVPLTHAIVGFGDGLHYELEKPTPNVDLIGEAIDHLKIDDTGTENTMHALQEVINHYSVLIKKDRRLLIVLVTDESGDDGSYVEEAHQAVIEHKVPVYVIGRQSLFGYERAHLRYIDPVTKDV